KPAVARLAPLDVPDARHARTDRAAENVESDRIADVDVRSLGDHALDRHLGLIGRRVPERSVDDALVRFEMIAIRNGEFAPQGNAALSHVFDAGEVRLTTGHADHARAQDGDQLKLAGTVRSIAKKRPDGVSLRPLNVE